MLPSSTTFCRESKPAFGAYRAVNDVLALDGVAADLRPATINSLLPRPGKVTGGKAKSCAHNQQTNRQQWVE